MFKRGEEVFGLETGYAGLVQSDEQNGMVRVWWYTCIESTVPSSQLMNSTDHLRMIRAQAIEEYRPALQELANRWSNSKESER